MIITMSNNRFLVCLIAAVMLAISCDGIPGGTVPVESVTLDKSAVTLSVGGSVKLDVSVQPSTLASLERVSWTSSEISVASVDDTGLIVALAEGVTVVTASVGGKSASCTVTVAGDPEKIEVTSLVIDKSELELFVGQKATITATVSPVEASGCILFWKSSDESVMTVKDGVVTAVKSGVAVVTVEIDDLSASCSVTVNEQDSEDEVADLGGGEHEGTTEEDILN